MRIEGTMKACNSIHGLDVLKHRKKSFSVDRRAKNIAPPSALVFHTCVPAFVYCRNLDCDMVTVIFSPL